MNRVRRMTLELPKLMLLGLISMSLAACTTIRGTETIVVSDFCDVARPITYSGSADTALTVQQVREHNHVYDTLCE